MNSMSDAMTPSAARARTESPASAGFARLEPIGDRITLPQAARRLDPSAQIWPSEVRIDLDTLNLDAASYRQLADSHRRTDGRRRHC